MTPQADQFGLIRLSAAQLQHPDLLTGLEVWLQLGLLSETQVRQFCRLHLTCPLPAVAPRTVAPRTVTPRTVEEPPPVASRSNPDSANDFVPLPAANRHTDAGTPDRNRSVGWAGRTLQALMAEIGVIWLLCLGVFMVVVSSGVLAASQWRNVAPIGQYGILLTYTLAFWGVSRWTGGRAALRITTRMLQIATLLIIPVNFWMMDGLGLWRTGLGVGLNLLAALVLTGIVITLVPQLAANPMQRRLMVMNSLGLSWLHWGWSLTGLPLIATYAGTIGTALLTYRQAEQQAEQQLHTEPDGGLDQEAGRLQVGSPNLLTSLIIALPVLLLLGRAIWAAQVPLHQLGLAFGICGWLFCWLARRQRGVTVPDPGAAPSPLTNLWSNAGIALLGLGWAVTVTTDPPWQAFAVSGLGLWLLGDQLERWGGFRSLLALVLLGLQTYALLWRLLPTEARAKIITTATQVCGVEGMPWVLLGLAGFPYLWLLLGLAKRWRRQQPRLVRATEGMALGLGGILFLCSLANPLVRSLTLTLATLTLLLTLHRRPLALGWFYFNHLLILATLAAWIDVVVPGLSGLAWARIVLLAVAIEWGLSLGTETHWKQSCWHFGLGLAGLSYALLLNQVNPAGDDYPNLTNLTNLIWLVTPALLAGLARLQPQRSVLAAWLSSGALVAQLFLLNSVDSWLLALGAATALMLVNTLTLNQLAAALLTIGFGLGWEAVALYRFVPDWLRFETVLLLLAANLWLLWIGQRGLQRWGQIGLLYGTAVNFWAVGVALFSLISLSLHSLVAYLLIESWDFAPELVIASGLIAAAIANQLRWQGSSEFGFLGLAWAVELFVIILIGWQGGSFDALTVATLALGFVSQLAGDFWVSRSRQTYRPSWHWIPLLYAGLAMLIGHHRFTATTGLYTLAAALIGIGVGRRSRTFKFLTLWSLLLASVAFYELLIYQLMQATGGYVGDGVTLLAGLAALVALMERLGQRWLLPYLRLESGELSWIAHLHWGLGSGLALVSLRLGLGDRGLLLWLLVATLLTGYALAHGRRSLQSQSAAAPALWTYLGILEVLTVIAYALYRLISATDVLLAWAGTLAAILALGLYFLPWHSWGWPQRPWCNWALLLPGFIVLLTAGETTLQSLLIVAAFYAWIAKTERRPRLSYLSLVLVDWAGLRFLTTSGWLNLTWISSLVAASLLYIAQIDPALRNATARDQRHWLRSLAVGLLSITMFYQAEVEPDPTALLIRLLTLGLALALIFLGLVLRVRAFLYVGTATFILQVLRLLWLFINTYSLLLWAIGIVMGLLFIWIAATFEARRSQMNALMQYWLTEFSQWE